MPRKLRPGKKRRVTPVDVSQALYIWLLWGDWKAAHAQQERDQSSKWELFDLGMNHDAVWRAIEPEAVAEWVTKYPGRRPRSWWFWSAPELRRVEGGFIRTPGRWRCQDTGIPYGHPIAGQDPPMVETQAAYLDRLGLWLPGERDRVPAQAFAPQVFSWTLTHD